MNRFTVRTGSRAAALAAVLLFALGRAALADAPIVATYQQQTIRFTQVAPSSLGPAIGVQDPGLAALLRALGAVVTWKPGDRYVLITTAVPVVVSFAVGDTRYDVGPVSLQARFAPYERNGEVYLPLDEVLRSLDLALRQEGGATILQPQLATLDVRASADRVDVVAHGGAPLRPRVVQSSSSAVTYEFDGVGTTLAGTRAVNAGGVRSLQIVQAGTVRDPKTLVTVNLVSGASYAVPRSNDDRDVVLSFAGGSPSSSAVAQTPPSPAEQSVPAAVPNAGAQDQTQAAAPAASAGPALVTGVTVTPAAGQGAFTIAVAVSGNANFEWHRLRDPDNRFWVDIKGAQLQGPPLDETEPDPIGALRVRQVDPQTVRVALSLTGPKSLALSPGANGLTIDVGSEDVADASRAGGGSIGSVVSTGEQTAPVTPAPIDEMGAAPGGGDQSGWKFGPRGSSYVPTNPRLIVIDPGHGGSDPGSQHGDLTEKDVTLDMAHRLRDLLVARGWQVKLTHDTDVDVYQPNDSAHDELQARVDVANDAGARLFVSIHANAYTNSGPYGTTCYVTKPGDYALARMVERQLQGDGTKDDGVIKAHYYVTAHALMPAVLIETAFLTNPGDYALLSSEAWRQKVAQEIADGIGQYAQSYPVPNQPAQ